MIHLLAAVLAVAPPTDDDVLSAEPVAVEDGEPSDASGSDPGDGEPSGDDAPDPAAGTPPEDATDETAPAPAPAVPPEETDFSQGLGGYHRPGEVIERPPPDGHKEIVAGSILVPLGTLATITSAVGAWLTVPAHCAERLGSVGVTVEDSSSCSGVFTFNVIRTTYGALMLASGSVILSIGLVRRERYRRWRLERGMKARLSPTLSPTGAGLQIRF